MSEKLCRERLSRSGRVCIWMHSYMMSENDFRMVVRTLCDAFGFVSIWETSPQDYALIASRQELKVPANLLLRGFATREVREDLYRAGAGDGAERVLGRFVAGGDRLRAWAGAGLIHSDDNAALEFSAPRWVHGGEATEIAQSLAAIRQSPFEEIVELTPGDRAHETLRARTNVVSDATTLRVKTLSQGRRGDNLAALRTLVEALELDPRNFDTRSQALTGAALLVQEAPPEDPRDANEARTLATRLQSMREPTLSPAWGRSLAEIAVDLRAKARAAFVQQRWAVAVDYLEEAIDLDPADAATIIDLSAALLAAGRRDEAYTRLESALAKESVTLELLSKSSHINRFRGDGRIAALLVAK